jgi:hypothetical protein
MRPQIEPQKTGTDSTYGNGGTRGMGNLTCPVLPRVPRGLVLVSQSYMSRFREPRKLIWLGIGQYSIRSED